MADDDDDIEALDMGRVLVVLFLLGHSRTAPLDGA